MSAKACLVTATMADGTRHSVEVTAETLFEAAAEAAGLLCKNAWVGVVGPATKFEVKVQEPAVVHHVTMQQLMRWLDGATPSPNEMVRKKKLKERLAS